MASRWSLQRGTVSTLGGRVHFVFIPDGLCKTVSRFVTPHPGGRGGTMAQSEGYKPPAQRSGGWARRGDSSSASVSPLMTLTEGPSWMQGHSCKGREPGCRAPCPTVAPERRCGRGRAGQGDPWGRSRTDRPRGAAAASRSRGVLPSESGSPHLRRRARDCVHTVSSPGGCGEPCRPHFPKSAGTPLPLPRGRRRGRPAPTTSCHRPPACQLWARASHPSARPGKCATLPHSAAASPGPRPGPAHARPPGHQAAPALLTAPLCGRPGHCHPWAAGLQEGTEPSSVPRSCRASRDGRSGGAPLIRGLSE